MKKTEFLDHIDHQGVVTSIDAAHNTVMVRVDDEGECGSCPAAALCSGHIDPANLVKIITPHAGLYRKDDIVTVRGTERMHHRAIMYATVLPCIILVAVMVGVYIISHSQLAAALCGLGTMILFFLILWVARNRVEHEFTFEIVGQPERAGEEK